MQDSDGARVLEEKHMISILLYLYEYGPSRKMEIYESVSKNPRMPDKIEKLMANGLLKTVPDPEGKSTILITLTDKGVECSKVLLNLDDLIKS